METYKEYLISSIENIFVLFGKDAVECYVNTPTYDEYIVRIFKQKGDIYAKFANDTYDDIIGLDENTLAVILCQLSYIHDSDVELSNDEGIFKVEENHLYLNPQDITSDTAAVWHYTDTNGNDYVNN